MQTLRLHHLVRSDEDKMLTRMIRIAIYFGWFAGTLLTGCDSRYQAMIEYDCRAGENECPSGFRCLPNADGRHLCIEEAQPEEALTLDDNLDDPDRFEDGTDDTESTALEDDTEDDIQTDEDEDACEENVCDPCPHPCTSRNECLGDVWTCRCDCSGSDEEVRLEDDGSTDDEDATQTEETENLDGSQSTLDEPAEDEPFVGEDSANEARSETSNTCYPVGDEEPIGVFCDRVLAEYIACLPNEEASHLHPECLQNFRSTCMEFEPFRYLWCPDLTCRAKLSMVPAIAECLIPE